MMADRQLRLALAVVRTALGLLLGIHGVTRLLSGGVVPFGEFLSARHFPLGSLLAWGITIFELVGPLCLIAGRFVRWVAPIHITILAMGIVLVHYAEGWFVVGGGWGGMEYSVLLILCLAAVFIGAGRRA